MPALDPCDDVGSELTADLDADPGYSHFNSRSPVALLISLSPLSATFSLFISFAVARTTVCLDASFLTDRASAFLATHAVGTGLLRDRYGCESHCGRDRKHAE
jgi:hypothetical protein